MDSCLPSLEDAILASDSFLASSGHDVFVSLLSGATYDLSSQPSRYAASEMASVDTVSGALFCGGLGLLVLGKTLSSKLHSVRESYKLVSLKRFPFLYL